MDTKKEDTDVRTAPEAPAMPAPGEPGPGPSAVPSVPLHGPVDVVDDSLEGLQSAFRALSVEDVDTNPLKRKREREKDAGESMADEGVGHEHDPMSESTLRRRTKRLWPPRITLSNNHHTSNSRPSRYNIHTQDHPAYG